MSSGCGGERVLHCAGVVGQDAEIVHDAPHQRRQVFLSRIRDAYGPQPVAQRLR